MSEKPSIGLMTLVHQRAALIPLICEQVHATWPDAVIHFTADRATKEVWRELWRVKEIWPGITLHSAPFPAIDHRENYIALRDWQLQRLHETGCKYIALWDDDHCLQAPQEAKELLEKGPDLVYCPKLYFWDSLHTINAALPWHNSVLFSKRIAGDKWKAMVGAPARAHEGIKIEQMETALLDVGYLTQIERHRVWEVYKRAGKIDDLTKGLILPPTLKEVPEEVTASRWYRKLETTLRGPDAGSLQL
jgi:hypothetical protein